jgi:hypothetical protein
VNKCKEKGVIESIYMLVNEMSVWFVLLSYTSHFASMAVLYVVS